MKRKAKIETPVKRQYAVIPQEDMDLLERADFIGHEYLRASRVRAKCGRTAGERKFLAEHDKVEERIKSDPKSVLQQALRAVDEGSALLLKLIRSKKLRVEFGEDCSDEAVHCFASRVGFMNQQLVRLSEDHTPDACFHLWYQAKDLADAVVRLAVVFPEEFRPMAESALTMPSLRARSADFTCDAEAVAIAIHLGGKHAAADIHDNRGRLGALGHFLVANIVEEVEWARKEREHFERLRKYAKEPDTEDIIPPYYHPDWRRLYEESWKLPELRGHAHEWWQGRVRAMVRREFDQIMKHSTRNPALRQELEKSTDHGTEAAKWRALEKCCFNKLQQIAGKSKPG